MSTNKVFNDFNSDSLFLSVETELFEHIGVLVGVTMQLLLLVLYAKSAVQELEVKSGLADLAQLRRN